MSESLSPREPEPAPEEDPRVGPPAHAGRRGWGAGVEPVRLPPLVPRRGHPWLIVEVGAAGYGSLVWALREAARREAIVVAVSVLDDHGDPLEGFARVRLNAQLAAHDRLEAQVLRAIAETGVHGRCRTAVLDRAVFDALTAATRGADLVVVGAQGKTLLRPAVPRPPFRRSAHGA